MIVLSAGQKCNVQSPTLLQITEFRAQRAAGGHGSPTAADMSPSTGARVLDHPAPASTGSHAAPSVARTLVLPGPGVPTPLLSSAPAGGYGGDHGVVAEKDASIQELRETVEILELKIKKLEQLVKLKDQRIQTLTARLQAPGSGGGV
jgi:hypothetical protein